MQICGTKRTRSESVNAHLTRDKTIPSLLNKSSGNNGNNSNVFTDEALRGIGAHILPSVTGLKPVRPEVAAKDSRLVEAPAVPHGAHACLAGCVCVHPRPICLRCLRADDTFIFRGPLMCCAILMCYSILRPPPPPGLVGVHTVSNSVYPIPTSLNTILHVLLTLG